MNIEQQIIYMNKNYTILSAEQEFILHPSALGILPTTRASLQCSFSCSYQVEDYRLVLTGMELSDDKNRGQHLENTSLRTIYNGAVLLGSNLIKEYYLKDDNPACFSYQTVLELIFENGMLITTVDQSKAMLRIRKNIELGLRSLDNNRDIRCIKRFLTTSLVGDYKPFPLNRFRMRYLKEMLKVYESINK